MQVLWRSEKGMIMIIFLTWTINSGLFTPEVLAGGLLKEQPQWSFSKGIRSKATTHSAGNLFFLQKTFIGHLLISSAALDAINTKCGWISSSQQSRDVKGLKKSRNTDSTGPGPDKSSRSACSSPSLPHPHCMGEIIEPPVGLLILQESHSWQVSEPSWDLKQGWSGLRPHIATSL